MRRLCAIALLAAAGSCAEAHIKAALAAYESAETDAKQGRHQEAVELFSRAVQIEPTYLAAYDGWIEQEVVLGRRAEAAVALTKALEIEPSTLRYRLLLGQILLEQKQTERALAQFSLALETDPSNADALAGFAEAATRLGMTDRAAEAMSEGRKKHPADARFAR